MRSFVFGILVIAFLFSVVCLGAPVATFGQETINYASLSGLVTDPTGAVVAGASVRARQIETNLTTTTSTDVGGRFRFAYLKVGPYELQVRHQGFAVATHSVTLTVGAAIELPVALALESEKTNADSQR